MKKLILSFIAVISITNLHSQNQHTGYPHVTPMSPEAAELAKYADYPVSHYTGTPNINIPLHEIDIDGFKLPISLNYHASGIRVDQEATWVGLGWSLDVGSRISRTVKGTDDFMEGTQDKSYPYCYKGYYNAPEITVLNPDINFINIDNQYEFRFGRNFPNPCPFEDWLPYDALLKYDTEPDIFYYNLPNGMNGKFILDKSRGAVLFDKSHNLKIEIITTWGTNNIKFKITDSEGNQYLYEKWEITQNYSGNSPLNKNANNPTKYDDEIYSYTDWVYTPSGNPGGGEGSYEAYLQSPTKLNTSWCLTKITTKNGRVINFYYDEEAQFLPTQESCEVYNFNSQSNLYYYRSKVVNLALRLKKIEGDFGSVLFNCSTREDIKNDALAPSKKLDAIVIYNNKNTLIKSYQFDYSYFNNNYSGSYPHVFKRLKLNKVTEYSDVNQPLNEGHSFEYYMPNDYHDYEFPAKNSKNVDYWGFQNGRFYGENYQIGLIINSDLYYPGVKKDANFDKTIIGTLKKITYPTGGIAEYKYEGHKNSIGSGALKASTYDNVLQNSVLNKRMDAYTASSDNPEENNEPISPSHQIFKFQIPDDTQIIINCHLENYISIKDPNYNYFNNPLGQLRRISPTESVKHTYICPRVYYDGDGQGGELVLKNDDGSGGWISQQGFPNLSAGTYEFETYAPPKGVMANWELSFSKPFTEIKESLPETPPNSTYQPYDLGGIRISEIKTDGKIRKFNYSQAQMLTEPTLYYFGTRAGIPDYIMDCTVQVSESKSPLSTFNQGNFVGYEWVEEYLTDENNKVSKTKYTFHSEMESEKFGEHFPDSPFFINYMNGLTKSIEKYKDTTLVEKVDFNYSSTHGSYINAFKDKRQKHYPCDILMYYYRPEWPLQSQVIKTEKMDNGNEIITETNYTYNSKDLVQTTTVKQSSSSSTNIPEIIQKVQYPFELTDAVSTAMVNDKNMVGVPVVTQTSRKNNNGEEILSTQKTIYKNSGGLFVPDVVQTSKGSAGIAGLENRLKYTNYDDKGNLLEVEQENGMKVSYIWGYKNTQPVAKLDNMAYADIPPALITAIQDATDSTTATEANVLTALNALRSSTDVNLQKAVITTLTYKPLVGVTTITDLKGNIQYYNYDTFGRLQNVKDKNGNILSENQYHYKN